MQFIYQKLKNLQLFLPISTKIICWNLLVLFFMIFDYITTILVTCYNNQTINILHYDVINYILPFMLLADILIQFNTGYIKNGKIITQRKPANLQYIKSIYFYADAISFIIALLQLISTHTFLPYITVLNYVVFIKLIKAELFHSLMKKYVIKSSLVLLYYQAVKNFVLLALLCHTIGSFYFLLSSYLYENGYYLYTQVWVMTASAMNNIYLQQFKIQYLYSFYFAIVTLSGTCYGDILPMNPIECLYIFLCFIFPMLIYAYVFNSIFTAIINRRSSVVRIRKYKLLTKQYLKSLGVNYKVLNKVVTYLQFTFKKDMIVDTSFIKDLAPTTKKQYLKSIMEAKFNVNCFDQMLSIAKIDHKYLKQMIYDLITQEYFPERSSLITPEKNKIYYINKGQILEVVKLNKQKKLSKPIQSKTYIGKTVFFTNQIPNINKFGYQTATFVICHSIEQKTFRKKIKEKVTILNEAYCYLQNQIIDEKIYQKMNQKCYFCDQIRHCLSQCPHLNLNRKQMIQKRNQKSQNRKYYQRDRFMVKKQKQYHKIKQNLLNSQNNQNHYLIVPSVSNLSKNQNSLKSYKIYQSNVKKVERTVIDLLMDKQFYEYLASFSIKEKSYAIQTNENQIIKDLNHLKFQYHDSIIENKVIENFFEKVCLFDNFYPQWNLV